LLKADLFGSVEIVVLNLLIFIIIIQKSKELKKYKNNPKQIKINYELILNFQKIFLFNIFKI